VFFQSFSQKKLTRYVKPTVAGGRSRFGNYTETEWRAIGGTRRESATLMAISEKERSSKTSPKLKWKKRF